MAAQTVDNDAMTNFSTTPSLALACIVFAVLEVSAQTAQRRAAGSDGNGQAMIRLSDVSRAAGLRFDHFAGLSVEKHLPEIMGGGAAWLDYDVDGHWDLYLVDSGALPGVAPVRTPAPGAGANAMFRARPGGFFDRADGARVAHSGFGMGVTVGDYDGDGFVDLFVANFGPNVLYRNNGDGTFGDVTATMGLGDARWGSSAAWGDLDLDGFPELYVANYLHYEVATAHVCGDLPRGKRSYCRPELYDGVADVLYRNIGGRAFEDITVTAGVANAADGKGLGVIIADTDGDRLPDIYVANDGTRNFLYVNRGALRFDDQGLFSGAGLSVNGAPQSGMGVDIGDLDGDGLPEIGVTNFEAQAINMYRSTTPGLFLDETFRFGTGDRTWNTLGFGLVFVDLDGDGDRDMVIANGHVSDDVDNFAQPNQVFANRHAERWLGDSTRAEGMLQEITTETGSALQHARVSRALAHGDADGDGWPDLVVSNIDGPIELLRNTSPRGNRRVVLRLRGRNANRDAYGSRVIVTTYPISNRPFKQFFEVTSATSYISQSSTDIHVGLGRATGAEFEVVWPGGTSETLGIIEAGQLVLAQQGKGVVATRRLSQ